MFWALLLKIQSAITPSILGVRGSYLDSESSHPCLPKTQTDSTYVVERIVFLLGLKDNEFNVETNSKATLVGKPVLNKDLDGKHKKLSWKYRTAVGMLNYLQCNTRLEIPMAVHQTARFCNDLA